MIPGWKEEIHREYLEFLRENPKAAPADFASRFGIPERCAIYWLSDLARDGRIRILAVAAVENRGTPRASESADVCQREEFCPVNSQAGRSQVHSRTVIGGRSPTTGGTHHSGAETMTGRVSRATPAPPAEYAPSPMGVIRDPSSSQEERTGGIASGMRVPRVPPDVEGEVDREVGMCWLADAMGARRPGPKTPLAQRTSAGRLQPERRSEM
jgi:hypothetical protein